MNSQAAIMFMLSVAVDPSTLGGSYSSLIPPSSLGLALNVAPSPLAKLKEHSKVADANWISKVPVNDVSEVESANTCSYSKAEKNGDN